MVFSSTIFIFAFLPLVLLFYFIVPKSIKNYVLLLFSLIFYIFGGPKFLFVLLAVVFICYFGALFIDKWSCKKFILFITLFFTLGILVYFKYSNFFISNINSLFGISLPLLSVVMPIGISFFTFQAISYVIDVYRGEVGVQKNPFLLLFYVSFFPQLVAGPIVRYQTIEKEIISRKSDIGDVSDGIERFILGLAKKVIIANQLGLLADIVYDSLPCATPIAWLGAICYMLQIYFDFSAYSDMAIGLGRIFGFHFLENFNFPYVSKSITDFWRRWHISLSTFFRDYVYIPLGGNRCSGKRMLFNLLVVWSLTGFWHGASWNFILWGLYYFVFLMIEKFFLSKYLKKACILSHIYTLFVVLIGWILFRSENLHMFFSMIESMFCFSFGDMNQLYIYLESYGLYLVLGFLFSTPIYYKVCDYFKGKTWFCALKYLGLLGLFVVCIMFLAKSSYNPFIYFRF